jgi:hypothetical protein
MTSLPSDPELEHAMLIFHLAVAERELCVMRAGLHEREATDAQVAMVRQATARAHDLEQQAERLRRAVIREGARIMAEIPDHHVWIEYEDEAGPDAVCVWCSVLRSEIVEGESDEGIEPTDDRESAA